MKIRIISSQDYGGAGKAAFRLHLGLKLIGADSKMIVLNKTSGDSDVLAIPDNTGNNLYNCFNPPKADSKTYRETWQKWMKELRHFPGRPAGLEMFTSPLSDAPLELARELRDADIVNLHWVAGITDFPRLLPVLKDKPVIWTLHDMNAFTGGCHYTAGCERFMHQCGKCPQLGSADENDISRRNWQIKKEIFDQLNIEVVTPSRWLAYEAGRSSLFRDRKISVIPYGFPLDKFKPGHLEELRARVGLSPKDKVVLFGADNIANKRKGIQYLLPALRKLYELGHKDIVFACFGTFPKDFDPGIPGKMLNFGQVASEEQIALIYSIADLFVLPSLEDNLPNTVVESMACGTPVAGFNIGGVPDMIEHKKTGYLVKPQDVDDLVKGISWLLYEADRDTISSDCINKAREEFPLRLQPERYLKLYERVLKEHGEKKPVTKEKMIFNISGSSNKLPKISIVTPSYNQGEYLEECIDSVLSQGYPNLEYIIMDGGSSDNSVDIIKKYEKYLVYWQSQPDGGQYAAVEDGFKRSSGEIMGWLNSDDFMYPFSFRYIASAFLSDDNIEWISGAPSMVNNEGREMVRLTLRTWSREQFLRKDYKFIPQENTFWKRSLWEKAGSRLSDYNLAGDLEIWVRFFRYARLYSIPVIFSAFRKQSDQKSTKYIDDYMAEAESIIGKEIADFKNGVTPGLLPAPATINFEKLNLVKFSEGENIAELISSARQNFQTGNYKEAVRIFRRLIPRMDYNHDLMNIYSAAETAIGNISNAKAVLVNSIYRDNKHSQAYKNIFELELSEKRYDNITAMSSGNEHVFKDERYRKEINKAGMLWNSLMLFQKIWLMRKDGEIEEACITLNKLTSVLKKSEEFKSVISDNFDAFKIGRQKLKEHINNIYHSIRDLKMELTLSLIKKLFSEKMENNQTR